MSKTPDETKKGLECCSTPRNEEPCRQCPYAPNNGYCVDKMSRDAFNLIQQLQAENAEQAERIRQLEAERDAAVADINVARSCRICRNLESDPVCAQCSVGGRNFEWRGLKKEATP